MVNKKALIIIAVVVITGVLAFFAFSGKGNSKNFPIENGVINCGYDRSCLEENLIACNASKFSSLISFDTYNITVLGTENEKCHFKFYLQYIDYDCLYPLTEMNENVFSHLFGKDQEGSCLSDACKHQETLIAEDCQRKANLNL